ncbi:MAG: hypothetical protein R3B47_09700 [Bacteroidia bacterium]
MLQQQVWPLVAFELSSNYIEVVRSSPDGGRVTMPSGDTTRYTCPGDGNPDVVSFMHSTTSAAQYAVITDDQNNISACLRATCRILKVRLQAYAASGV